MINYDIKRIDTKTAKEYIHKNHYSRGSHNSPSPCYGLFDKNNLIGVIMFATPCSENVRSSIFSVDRKNEVTELHRLHILDVTPKNTESWFISRALKKLKEDKPIINAVISFADPTEGHTGTIYKATNAYFVGISSAARFYRDKEGRLRHPRQNGTNITVEEAKKREWLVEKRLGKMRYLWLLPLNKKHKKELIKECKLIK
jgi:hypothetical protein